MIGSGSTRAVLVRDGSEQERDDGNQRVKATKRGGTDDWKSELVVVPMKPGNQLNGTRRREGRAGTRNCWRAR